MKMESIEILVEQRLACLRSKSVAELTMFPTCEKETVQINGKDVTIFTMHEMSKTGVDRFIVQAIRPRWGGITEKVVAQGFEMLDGQTVRMLTREDLYDYT